MFFRRLSSSASTWVYPGKPISLSGKDAMRALPVTTGTFRVGHIGPEEVLENNVHVFDISDLQTNTLIPKGCCTPAHSWLRWCLPLSTNTGLQATFQLFGTRQIRIGRILELLDAFTADVAYRHASVGGGPYESYDGVIVTAALDQLAFDKLDFSFDEDLILEGSVCRVGRSSMDVNVDVTSGNNHVSAHFILVARELGSAPAAKTVPKLVPILPVEKVNFQRYNQDHVHRVTGSQNSLSRIPPSNQETQLIHSMLYTNPQQNVIPIHCTVVSKTMLMHQQHRNIHGKIFGGFLTREAFELAWVCTYNYCKVYPVISRIDDISFLKPVEVGSIMSFEATLSYSRKGSSRVIVDVKARVLDPQTDSSELTNTFYFEFDIGTLMDGVPVVSPRTYDEAMMYLDGRRRHQRHI